jgi:hypothetical protein
VNVDVVVPMYRFQCRHLSRVPAPERAEIPNAEAGEGIYQDGRTPEHKEAGIRIVYTV